MRNLLSSLYTFAKLGFGVYYTAKKDCKNLLKEHAKAFDSSALPQSRIAFYCVQSHLTTSWFQSLRGKKATATEKRNALLIGALTPILDDFTDDEELVSGRIIAKLQASPKSLPGLLYNELQENCPEHFHSIFRKALEAQDLSLQQLQKEKLSLDQLLIISKAKGGYFTLLFRACLEHSISIEEKEMILNLGLLLQQCNDIFDIYKDREKGQQTFIFSCNSLDEAKICYLNTFSTFKKALFSLEAKVSNKMRFFRQISPIHTRALVCYKQLEKVLTNENLGQSIRKASRKDLICDMEKPSNLLLSFSYAIAANKTFYQELKSHEKAHIPR